MSKIRICIAGVYPISEGYPNVKYRLKSLKSDSRYHVEEINCHSDDWKGEFGIVKVSKFFNAHIKLVYKLWKSDLPNNFDCIYIPYPSILSAIIARCLARNRTIIIDAFISIYDTVVIDRKLVGGFLGKILLKLEKFSFACASCIIVDTQLNADYYAHLFNIDQEKIIISPLFTSELATPESSLDNARFKVLFIGNMVPLHGIEVIAKTIVLLSNIAEINFRVIGDGQESKKIQEIVANSKCNISWHKKWLNEEEISREIANANVCLGIFSENNKTQRVCPYKLYLYSFHGKAIITGDTTWARSVPDNILKTTPLNNPEALADAILEIYHSSSLQCRFGKNAKLFYESALSNKLAEEIFYNNIIINIKNDYSK